MAKSEHRSIKLGDSEISIHTRHEDRGISFDTRRGRTRVHAAIYPWDRHIALGARVRVDPDAEEDITASVYLGGCHVHVGVHHPLLSKALHKLKVGRAVTDLDIHLSGEGEIDGTRVIVSGHLWDDDHCGNADSRAMRLDLTSALLGKLQRGPDVCMEEREVEICFPEGNFTTLARRMERKLSRPRGLFARWYRWVEFQEMPVLVPHKHSDVGLYDQGGPTGVSARSIEDGIAELTRRVLEQRARYGGREWRHGPPATKPHESSHDVSVWRVSAGKPRAEEELQRAQLLHGQTIRAGHAHLTRCPKLGAVMVRMSVGEEGFIERGRWPAVMRWPVSSRSPMLLLPGDVLCIGEGRFKVYGAAIGPVWSREVEPEPSPPDVSAASLLKSAERLGVNAGPALARTGRLPLKGLSYADIQTARAYDPQWYRANRDIVSGAREGLVYDGNCWQPTDSEVEADVAETVAQLDTDLSPGEAVESREAAAAVLGRTIAEEFGEAPAG